MTAASSTPRVSVIMAAHNCDSFVEDAVASVLAQTFGDFELVVVDDGSTDSTGTLLDRAAVRDARVRVIHLDPNRGVSAARNTALATARGAYLAIADADDINRPTRLERQVAFLDEHPDVDVVGTRYEVFDTDPTKSAIDARHDAFFRTASVRNGRIPVPHPTMMFRRRWYDEQGGYDPDFDYAEDHELLARYAIGGARSAMLDSREYLYRIHAASATSAKSRRVISQSLRVNRKVRASQLGLSASGRRYAIKQRIALLVPDVRKFLRR